MSRPSPVGASAGVKILTSLAVLSGCCGLAYEVLYLRALTTVLGDMLYVHAALLSTFLVGIALGAKLARRCLRWLWLIEISTGVYAFALPAICRWLNAQSILATISSSPSLTIVTTVVLLSVPSLLIGFSIPLFSAYIKKLAEGKLAFQGIYMAYNFGALASVLAVEMLMVRHFGISKSLAVIGAINVLNGVLLLWMAAAPDHEPTAERRRFDGRVLTALVLVGVVSSAFQMFFLKLTYMVFGPHRENFAVSLSMAMLGIFSGSWLASRVKVRFETLLLLVPLAVGVTYACYVPMLALNESTLGWAAGSPGKLLFEKFVIGSMFALGPMVLFGATLPALMRTEREVAGESGHLLFITSMANAAGFLLYVLVGHPLMTNDKVLAAIAGLSLAGAFIASGFRFVRWQWITATAGIVALMVMIGLWQEKYFYLAQWYGDLDGSESVTTYKFGAENATLTVDNPNDEWISYNGQPSIWVKYRGVIKSSEVFSGVIPALSAPSLKRAMVLGLGTGITSGTTSRLFEHTDVVEINPSFRKMMARMAYASLDIGNNPGATIHFEDGRSFLIGKDGQYDAIVNSISAPTYYSAAKIYTVEFYRRVAVALKPGGVFCGWIAPENFTEQGTITVLAALHDNFKYCDLRMVSRGYYMTTCSNEPLKQRRFSELPAELSLIMQVKADLPRFNLDEFFEDMRVSTNLFDHYTPHVDQPNTDDHPVLEFMVVRGEQLESMGENPFIERRTEMNVDPIRLSEIGMDHRVRLARRARAYFELGADEFTAIWLPVLKSDPELWKMWIDAGYDEDPNS